MSLENGNLQGTKKQRGTRAAVLLCCSPLSLLPLQQKPLQ